ncbi:UNKNOWN [Stylonychia lemnae]|uniref:Uncharacterized protein n=1 Tax=Stylonychia lemnae TaxID=5949 RepID=A0A077ZW02_STYLE|nr:UNKNOWN [Stylonychia lemnae]|eukprot:CDW74054.1 UNKNOWN [Stylonychia lemnae]
MNRSGKEIRTSKFRYNYQSKVKRFATTWNICDDNSKLQINSNRNQQEQQQQQTTQDTSNFSSAMPDQNMTHFLKDLDEIDIVLNQNLFNRKSNMKGSEHKIKEEMLLSSMATYKLPIKFESKLISLYRNQNPTHDSNNEKADSIISNLNREGLDKNPFYNHKRLDTSHGKLLDKESLFKLGQITVSEYQKSRTNKSKLKSYKVKNPKDNSASRNLNFLESDHVAASQDLNKQSQSINLSSITIEPEQQQKDQQMYYMKKLRPWQIYFNEKVKQIRRAKSKYDQEDLDEVALRNAYIKNLMEFQQKQNALQDLAFLNNPADKCMLKILFKKDDTVMKFYEKKYRFQMKDVRPFAQHTDMKEFSALHNDDVFNDQMKVFLEQDRRQKKLQRQRYREIQRSMNKTSFMQPLKTNCCFDSKRQSFFSKQQSPFRQKSMDKSRGLNFQDTIRSNSVAQNSPLIKEYATKEEQDHNQTIELQEGQNVEDADQDYMKAFRESQIFGFHDDSADLPKKTDKQLQQELKEQLKQYKQLQIITKEYYDELKNMMNSRNLKNQILPLTVKHKPPKLETLEFQGYQIKMTDRLNKSMRTKKNKEMNQTSKYWHLNYMKQISTEQQLLEQRINKYKKLS